MRLIFDNWLNVKKQLITGSSSPRRHELLRLIHPYFEIKHPRIKEIRKHNESPDLYVNASKKEKHTLLFKIMT